MSFHEVVFNAGIVGYDAEGGPMFSTDIARMGGGGESRNARWDEALGNWNAGDIDVDQTELAYYQSFFRARKGMAYAFRWKDWGDFECSLTQGYLVAQDVYPPTGVGNGMPTYDLWKRYYDDAAEDWRRIYKPVGGTVTVQRNSTNVAPGSGAGEVGIDVTSGRVTFVADAVASASSLTVGATTQVVLPTTVGGLASGKRLYLSGFTGGDAALVNAQAHEIIAVTGAGPYTFTLNVNTAGKSIAVGAGQGRKYPQASDVLRFASEFDTPVRFGTDQLRYRFLAMNAARTERIYYLQALPLVLERNPLV